MFTLPSKVAPARNWAKVRAFDSPFRKCTLLSSVFERMCFLLFPSFVSKLRTVVVPCICWYAAFGSPGPSSPTVRLLSTVIAGWILHKQTVLKLARSVSPLLHCPDQLHSPPLAYQEGQLCDTSNADINQVIMISSFVPQTALPLRASVKSPHTDPRILYTPVAPAFLKGLAAPMAVASSSKIVGQTSAPATPTCTKHPRPKRNLKATVSHKPQGAAFLAMFVILDEGNEIAGKGGVKEALRDDAGVGAEKESGE